MTTTSATAPAARGTVPRASTIETLQTVSDVLVPLAARGLLLRRPPVVAGAERLRLEERAVRRMQRLRQRHGLGPLLLRLPAREVALVLSPEDVHRVLAGSPEPFAPATREKRAALGHFQPAGLLISSGPERADRRAFNERVLDTERPLHRLAAELVPKVREEASALLDRVAADGTLTWDAFITAWFRLVRRVVLGDAARDDELVTDLLQQLRADANWAYLKPSRDGLRERMLGEVARHVDRREPGSLATVMAATPTTTATQPVQQVPQWLFAFDAAGIAACRALALLAASPDQRRQVRDDLAGRDLTAPQPLPLLRASVLEALRLWPTTPGILRESTAETTWATGTLPAGATVLIFAPFFHRDDERLPYAHRFEPGLWLHPRGTEDWPLVPFSSGPGACPGRNLVLLTTTTFLAALLEEHSFQLDPPDRLDAAAALPGVLNPFDLRFRSAPPADEDV